MRNKTPNLWKFRMMIWKFWVVYYGIHQSFDSIDLRQDIGTGLGKVVEKTRICLADLSSNCPKERQVARIRLKMMLNCIRVSKFDLVSLQQIVSWFVTLVLRSWLYLLLRRKNRSFHAHSQVLGLTVNCV